MLENAKIHRIKCEILGNFQTLCPWLEGQKKWEIHQIHFILYVFCQIPYNTVGGGQIFLRPSKRGHINFWPSSQIGTVSFFLPVCESSSSHTSQFPVSEYHRKSLIQYYERSSEEFLSTYFCASIALSLFLPSAKDSKKHGVWKSQKKYHSIMRAKRAMVTFFNEQKVIKNAKNPKLVVKRCYWKGRFKLSKNPKIQTRLFWVIFN